jgi:hypothetical protein
VHLGVFAAISVLLVAGTAINATAATTPAAQWAPKFCTAISNFQTHLTNDGTQADAVLSGNITSLNAAKNALASFMNKATTDADTAITALKKAGAPDAPNGAKIASAFVTAMQNARSLFVSAKNDAQHLPTKNLKSFEAATQKITSKLNRGGNEITNSFSNVQALDTSGQIAAAAAASPACSFLSGSGSSTTSTDCTTSAQALSAAEEAYFATNNKYASSQDELVSGGFLQSKDSNYNVTASSDGQSYQVVPIGSTCPPPST